MNNIPENFKRISWKTGVSAPLDANRPTCKHVTSLDGVTGKIEEDATDLVDWLIVIAYETKENK